MARYGWRAAAVTLVIACGDSRPQGELFGEGDDGIGDASTGAGAPGDDDDGDPGGDSGADSADDEGGTLKLDVGDGAQSEGGEEGGECETEGCECVLDGHQPCDAGNDDPLNAIGLDCPGELAIEGATMGSSAAIGLRSGFGGTNAFAPREGELFLVLGSGNVADLDLETPNSDGQFGHDDPTHCNDDLGAFDPGNMLPPPLDPTDVGPQTCAADQALVGTGDCSNTLQEQWDQAAGGGCVINGVPCGIANDYTELRFTAEVPADASSFSYDLAFFTTEWPAYFGSQYNDFYVGWLESEQWTGNISFDAGGHPISLNAAFFDYLDDDGNLPELADSCMRYHGGTQWLTTTAAVTPGETITVVFAIFDLSDSILDSYVFLDDFRWGCEGGGMPQTRPEG